MASIMSWVQERISRLASSHSTTHNDFAISLYERLCAASGNLIFSPLSVHTVMAMAYAGARDKTTEQMRSALCFTEPDHRLHATFSDIIQRLNAEGGGMYEMTIANSLWGQEDAAPKREFLDLTSVHYGQVVRSVDFRRNWEVVHDSINSWVADQTKGKIRDLIPPGGVDAETRLVLTNAVYFKGKWVLEFDRTETRNQPFYLEGGGDVFAPLMRKRGKVRYFQEDGFQAVDLDYRGVISAKC